VEGKKVKGKASVNLLYFKGYLIETYLLDTSWERALKKEGKILFL
jgi:hypothetical protein